MIRWIINWRHNLFVAMLILLSISSLCPQTKELCLGWGVEQQRLRERSIQVIQGYPLKAGQRSNFKGLAIEQALPFRGRGNSPICPTNH
jgi:hypothetical protein